MKKSGRFIIAPCFLLSKVNSIIKKHEKTDEKTDEEIDKEIDNEDDEDIDEKK